MGSRERQTVRIGKEAMLPDDPRSQYARCVNFAPENGQTVDLNPPRFRWSYHPDGYAGGLFQFVFQIARDRDFTKTLVDVTTPFNFYNTLAPLKGEGPFYWRVGYVPGPGGEGSRPARHSAVRQFRVAPDAQVWDRSMLAGPDFAARPHPRILLSETGRKRILALDDDESREVLHALRAEAAAAMKADWYAALPASDLSQASEKFLTMAHQLAGIAFLYRLTGEKQYASVIDRAVTLAGYPKGGRSSPEPLGESHEDSTQITEFIALMYDWLWPELTEAQRRVFVKSLAWRIDHFVNDFAWKRRGPDGAEVYLGGSLSTICASHSFEGFWDTFPAALACYEDSPEARECFHLGVNWLVGVSSGHGFDEGWNEGPGYSTSKFKWLMHSAAYLDSVFPEFKVGSHPWFRRVGEWFSRVTPVGLKRAPWGHGSNREGYYRHNRSETFRTLAYLTGEGMFLRNWRESGGKATRSGRLWIQLAVPASHPRPAERLEKDPVGLFPLAGWVMAGTHPPSSAAGYEKSVGMIFASRPVGAYSHAFAADNSFHVYGYGQDLTFAGGTSAPEPYTCHSMSHNTVLIDGIGQSQPGKPEAARAAFLRAFARGEGYLYWAGDATGAYPKTPHRHRGYWGRFADAYETLSAGHLRRFIRHVVFLRGKYFVIFDDLAADRPAKFSWLFHILPGNAAVDRAAMAVDYRVGDVPVRLVHAARVGELELLDLKGAEGFKNPLTGEDYTFDTRRATSERPAELVAGHNLWISNREKAKDFHFLSVLAPVAPGARPPKIARLDDHTVQVGPDVVSFDPKTRHPATIIIDAPALRAAPPRPDWYTAPAEDQRPKEQER